MKKSTLHKGFTLIELLVVVAIIGLLAATILASLGSARAKARLARAQSEVSSMRAAAELYYSTEGSYVGVFDDDSSGMKNLFNSVKNTYTEDNIAWDDTDSTWVFSFSPDDTTTYCADSNGYSGKSTTIAGSSNPKCTPPIVP